MATDQRRRWDNVQPPQKRPKWGQHLGKTNDFGFLAETVLDAVTHRGTPKQKSRGGVRGGVNPRRGR
eukprot:6356883-Pyramimonas_sp.AAC.1